MSSTSYYVVLALLVSGCCMCGVSATAAATTSVTVIDLTKTAGSPLIAVRAAAGLDNRNGAEVYTVGSDNDEMWLTQIIKVTPGVHVTSQAWAAYLAGALAKYPAIVYNASNADELPAVITLAGVMSAVPLDAQLLASNPHARVAFNATGRWASQQAAAQYAASATLNATTTLCLLDPSRIQDGYLVDWVVHQRLFTTYLPNMCLPWTKDNVIFKSIVAKAPWPQPTTVYGYNGQDQLFGGDLFEAETDCINHLGQVASDGVTNYAFWSEFATDTPPLQQYPSPPVTYSKDKAYVSLVYGDMDNIAFVESFGASHMEIRSQRCTNATGGCFPLTWTMSPNLVRNAPRLIQWYYEHGAMSKGQDWFIMPPSGWLYSYPGEMPDAVQTSYAAEMQEIARLMNTSGSVHWEWTFTWSKAYDNYFPRFVTPSSQAHGVRAFMLNNVPWVIPILSMDSSYRVFRGGADDTPVVMFKPAFNWCDGCGGGNPSNATEIAARLNHLPLGAIEYVYIIQNTPIDDLFDMVSQLEPHVELVSYEQLAGLALQADA